MGTNMADKAAQQPTEGIKPGNPPLPAGAFPEQIIHNPPTRPRMPPVPPPARTPPKGPGPGDMQDGSREIIETIVFVVVLVLLLKTFLAEAFVIPTGSMATTLLGYHQEVTCDMCGYGFLVNASSEAEDKNPQVVTKGYCPNCRYLNVLRRPLFDGELP
jgi:signal peptidase I